MAGRGRDAVLPAWMLAKGGAAPTAPGAPAATPGAPAAAGAAPGAPMHSPGQAAARPALQPSPAAFQQAPQQQPPQQQQPYVAAPGMGGPRPGMPLQYGMPPGAAYPGARPAAPGGMPYGQAPPMQQQPPPQQQQQQPYGAPAAGAAAPQQQQPAAAAAKPEWSEHTAPDGRKYYFNSRTKQSSWERPAELMRPEERGAAAAPAGAAAAAVPTTDWKEFTAPNGRKYYYNKVTKESVWTMPEEMKAALAAAGAAAAVAAGGGAAAPAAAPAAAGAAAAAAKPAAAAAGRASGAAAGGAGPVAGIQTGPTLVFATTAEAKDAFKQMLADVGIGSGATWDETLRIVANDRRFGGLKTVGERKAAFNEFVQQRKKEEAEEARQKRLKAKEEFYSMLDECKELGAAPKFSRARDLLELDARWQAVDSTKEREELFEDWAAEREKAAREARKAEKKRKRGAFRELLEGSRFVKVDTSWRKAQDRLAGEEEYEALDKLDRLEVFTEYMRDLERKEREAREREREERKRAERRNRDAFKELLAAHRREGVINAKTRWKEYLPVVSKEAAYEAVERNLSGSRPKELFQDIVEEMEEEYDKSKGAIKDTMKAAGVQVTPTSTFDDFKAALGSADSKALADVSDTNLKLYFGELVGRAQEAAAKAERAAKRVREDFFYMMKHMRDVKPDTTWADAEAICGKEHEWKAVSSDEERKQLFEEYMAKLQAKAAEREEKRKSKGEEGAASDEDRKERKKKHKKEKRRHEDKDDDKSSKRHKRDRHKERSRSRSRSAAAKEQGEVEVDNKDTGSEPGEVPMAD